MSTASRDFWEQRYRTAAAAGTRPWGAAPNGWVAERVRGLPPGAALDLGAGDGRNALHLAAAGWSVTAVDFAAAAVASLRREAAAAGLPVDAVVADATTWTGVEPVDLTVLCYLQLEPSALAAAIARGAAALRPGGLLLGIWHDREDAARGLGGTMAPAIRTTPGEVRAAAEEAGLDVALAARRDRPVEGGAACDALLVARRPGGPA